MIEYVSIPEERMKLLRKNEDWKKQLKKFTDMKVEVNDEISIEGDDVISVMRVKEIFRAFGRGFDFKDALDLLDEEFTLETIELKDFAGKSKSRQITLKGRVIGTFGKMKKSIEKYAEVKVSIYGKTISIIGKWQNIQIAKKAIEMLLSGAMHTTVYRFLEKQKW